MKNIQFIEGAQNCSYDIFSVSEDDFALIFPGEHQDVEFSTDIYERLGHDQAEQIFTRMWKGAVKKPDVNGIHGTIFYRLDEKKRFYPDKNSGNIIG